MFGVVRLKEMFAIYVNQSHEPHLILTAPLRGKRADDDLILPMRKQRVRNIQDPKGLHGIQQCIKTQIWVLCTLLTCYVTLTQALPFSGVWTGLWDPFPSGIMWAGEPVSQENNKAGCFQIFLYERGLNVHFEHIKALGRHGGVLWFGWWILPELVLQRSHANWGKGKKKKTSKTKSKHDPCLIKKIFSWWQHWLPYNREKINRNLGLAVMAGLGLMKKERRLGVKDAGTGREAGSGVSFPYLQHPSKDALSSGTPGNQIGFCFFHGSATPTSARRPKPTRQLSLNIQLNLFSVSCQHPRSPECPHVFILPSAACWRATLLMTPRGLASPLPCREQDIWASGIVATSPGPHSFKIRGGTLEEPHKRLWALRREEWNWVRETGWDVSRWEAK